MIDVTEMLTPETSAKITSAIEDARKEGVAIIGYVLHPHANGLIPIDNQGLTKDKFVAMMDFTNQVFATLTTTEPPKIKLVN